MKLRVHYKGSQLILDHRFSRDTATLAVSSVCRLAALLVSSVSDVRERSSSDLDPGPVDPEQRRPAARLQLHGPTHKATGPQVPAAVFTSSLFVKSALRNVYSPAHVCFHLICAPHRRGGALCVCFSVGSGKLERIQHELPKQTKGWWSLINDLLDGTLTHKKNSLGRNGLNKGDKGKSRKMCSPRIQTWKTLNL